MRVVSAVISGSNVPGFTSVASLLFLDSAASGCCGKREDTADKSCDF